VCVSDIFDVKTIIEKITGFATGLKLEILNMDHLQTSQRTQTKEVFFLLGKQKKYLIVLDNV